MLQQNFSMLPSKSPPPSTASTSAASTARSSSRSTRPSTGRSRSASSSSRRSRSHRDRQDRPLLKNLPESVLLQTPRLVFRHGTDLVCLPLIGLQVKVDFHLNVALVTLKGEWRQIFAEGVSDELWCDLPYPGVSTLLGVEIGILPI